MAGDRSPSPSLTLGTAGHIDHGKTALVSLLTGTNTDRLREERERGISIELGYADLTLPGGGRLSVVDVPGHERFVRTMVAGATGIDLFLLVVAADDGVMPQTVEHLAIIELLGVRHGVVALSKADLVDDELLQLAATDVRELLAGGPYEGCEVIPVSSRDGSGVDEVLAALERAVEGFEVRRREGPLRLPIDRVFPLKGIGTVVTGTIWRGEVRPGDTLVVEPGGARAVVRTVQVHESESEAAGAGSRVGLSLRGLSREEVERGGWLLSPELAGRASRRFDVWVKVLADAPALRVGTRARVHHGTAQHLARITPLGGREIAPGAEGLASLRFEEPVSAEPHDRFVARALSPVVTIGGGEVLAARRRRWRERDRHDEFLQALRSGDPAAAAYALAADAPLVGVARGDLLEAGWSAREVAAAFAALERSGRLEALRSVDASRWFVAGALVDLRSALVAAAAERAEARPQRPFSSAAELAVAAPLLPLADVQELLRLLAEEGALVADEGGYAPAGAGVLGREQAALAEVLLGQLDATPLTPPTLSVLVESVRRPSREVVQVLDVLARRGEVVRLDKELWLSAAAVDGARAALLELFEADGRVTIASLRDRLACGRRNAQALLEFFDREGLTLRRGDERVLRRRRG